MAGWYDTMGERTRLGIAVVSTTVVVVAFAVLQYRWSNDVREAASVRLGDTLQLSIVNWHMDFFRSFSDVCLALRHDPEAPPGDADRYARRLDEWRAIARYPELVSNIYLLDTRADAPSPALFLNPATRQLEPEQWPARLTSLRTTLGELSAGRPGVRGGDGGLEASPGNLGGGLREWRFEPSVPALVRPMVNHRNASASGETLPGPVSFLVVELNAEVIQARMLDDLAHRYFQGTDGLDYEVAVVAGARPRRVLYTSDPGFGSGPIEDADGMADLFLRGPGGPSGAVRVFHLFSPTERAIATRGMSWFPLLRETPVEEDWFLVVRHRRGGSLSAFVAGTHRRQLAFSFGALLLLATSMAMLIVASMRAHRLGQLQMDFVTTVSHELRTPITVIRSAADNIAHGAVEGGEALKQYGTLIGRQVRQLSGLVEEILDFAATSEGRRPFLLQPLSVEEIIEAALAATAELIESAQFTVEQQVAPGLPRVVGDRAALSQCLQNLLTNALKYGKAGRWIGIQARLVEGIEGPEVQVSVSDRGIGIERSDLARIFEPFYRSPATRTAQIHGTGLGLSVAKRFAEAMKGRLTVTSAPGRGSTFTVHLSPADIPDAQSAVPTHM